MKRPGVYLMNGFIQLAGVSPADEWQEVSLVINKGISTADPANDFIHACKIGPIQNGGVPFTFTVYITEALINEENTAADKAKGRA